MDDPPSLAAVFGTIIIAIFVFLGMKSSSNEKAAAERARLKAIEDSRLKCVKEAEETAFYQSAADLLPDHEAAIDKLLTIHRGSVILSACGVDGLEAQLIQMLGTTPSEIELPDMTAQQWTNAEYRVSSRVRDKATVAGVLLHDTPEAIQDLIDEPTVRTLESLVNSGLAKSKQVSGDTRVHVAALTPEGDRLQTLIWKLKRANDLSKSFFLPTSPAAKVLLKKIVHAALSAPKAS